MSKKLQFYGHDKTGYRRILSFKVESIEDAKKGLVRFNIPSGWYVVKAGDVVKSNDRIYNGDYQPNKPESIWDKIDKMMEL